MIEDRVIIMRALRDMRMLEEMTLDTAPVFAVPTAFDYCQARLNLSRINAEIARRCWNRLAVQAARLHSPIGD